MNNYPYLFQMAMKNTEMIGCELDGMTERNGFINREFIIRLFSSYLDRFKFDLCKDVCGQCVFRHLDFQRELKQFDINSIITIGDVLVEGKYRYNTNLEYLKDQLKIGVNNRDVFNAHVWLTLETYETIDIVLQSSRVCNKEIKIECFDDELVIIDQAATGFKYEYKPLLVGKDYLFKTHEIELRKIKK